MGKTIIFTDSTCDLTKELIETNNIKVIPFIITIGGKTYYDGVDIFTSELESLIKKYKQIPTTAATSAKVYVDKFKPFIENGDEIFFVGIGAKLSSGIKSLELAVSEFEKGKIEFIDSANLSTATGLQVLKACKLRDEGLSAKEIKSKLEVESKNVFSNFSVFTYDYLKKGGRVSHTKAFFASLLKIKPILGVRDGILSVRKLERGKFKASVDFQLRELKFHYDNNNLKLDYLFITHFFSEAVDYVLEEIKRLDIKIKNIYPTIPGTVISSHCGPGALGLIYEVIDNKLEFPEVK